jgi:hypothetical protein
VAIGSWRTYHIAVAWLAALCISVALLAAYAEKHASHYASGGSFEVSFVKVVWPLWMLVLIGVLLVTLLTLTTLWARRRRS